MCTPYVVSAPIVVFAYGLFVLDTAGMVPFPIILGAVFDKACLVWEDKCGEKGSCWIYDGKLLSRGITAWILSAGVLTAVLYGVALKMYKMPADDLEPYHEDKDGARNNNIDATPENDLYISERF